MSELRPPLANGARIGPYEVIGRLGRGGMATVYLAKAVERCPVALGRPVAVKVLTVTKMAEAVLPKVRGPQLTD